MKKLPQGQSTFLTKNTGATVAFVAGAGTVPKGQPKCPPAFCRDNPVTPLTPILALTRYSPN